MTMRTAAGGDNCGCERLLSEQQNLRHRQRFRVRDREERSPDLHRLGAASSATMQLQPRWTSAAHDLDVLPEHAARMARAQRLHRRFLGRESAGEMGSWVPPLGTIRNLPSGKHALQKALAVAFENFRESGDISGVEADAEDVHDPATA
jgi:hypothetical protein